jgi:hypothetical protein
LGQFAESCAVPLEPEDDEDDEDAEGEADCAFAMAAPLPMRTPVSVSAAAAIRSRDFISFTSSQVVRWSGSSKDRMSVRALSRGAECAVSPFPEARPG